MKRATLFLCLACAVLAVRAQRGPHSKVLTDSIHSEILGAWRHYTVYLPKSFDGDTQRQYPILYLLHGWGGTNKSWFDEMNTKAVLDLLTASGEACEMVVVSPDAGSEVNGYFNMPGWAYEDFFFREFVPHVEGAYRAIGDKRHRAVAGLSMGGGGAASYAQRHPDMFCAAYAMSALMDVSNDDEIPLPNPDDKTVLLFASVRENGCITYLEEADEARRAELGSVEWFVDCGDDDFLLDRNVEFHRLMRQAQLPCQLRVRDGGHTREYWHSALYTCLPFVTRCFCK